MTVQGLPSVCSNASATGTFWWALGVCFITRAVDGEEVSMIGPENGRVNDKDVVRMPLPPSSSPNPAMTWAS